MSPLHTRRSPCPRCGAAVTSPAQPRRARRRSIRRAGIAASGAPRCAWRPITDVHRLGAGRWQPHSAAAAAGAGPGRAGGECGRFARARCLSARSAERLLDIPHPQRPFYQPAELFMAARCGRAVYRWPLRRCRPAAAERRTAAVFRGKSARAVRSETELRRLCRGHRFAPHSRQLRPFTANYAQCFLF